MLQVHDKNRFNDDGTLRRKYESEDSGEARTGLRVAIGLAIASVVSFVKNVAQVTPQHPSTTPGDEPADTPLRQGGEPPPQTSMESLDQPAESQEAADTPVDPGASPSGKVVRFPVTRSQDFGTAPRSSASPNAGEISTLQPVPQSALWPGGTTVGTDASFVSAESQFSFSPQGNVSLVRPTERTSTNRRPGSLENVWLGTVFLNAHLAIEARTLLSKSVDPDGDQLTVKNLTVSSGQLTLNADGSWHYLPVYNDPRPVVFRYQVSDGELDTWQLAVLKFDPPPSVSIEGTPGPDDLMGTVGVDQISGYDGDDLLIGREGADVISGGSGSDRIVAGDGNDVVWAGAGNDFVLGGHGNDVIHGEAGDDILHGEEGDDVIVGGEGNDQLFGGSGNDALVGGTGADTIDGGAGEDVVDAGDGDDVIVASDGNDVIDGGAGLDTYDASAATKSVIADLAAGSIEGTDTSLDRVSSVEQIKTGSGDDIVTGSAAADVISTGGGNDEAQAGIGADVVQLGAGDDVLNAERDESVKAVDAFDGGAGNDTLKVDLSQACVTIDLEADRMSFANGASATIVSFENVVTDGGGNAHVHGDAQANVIQTGDGNDRVAAAAGADTVSTGAGNDTLIVAMDGESDQFDGGEGIDLIDLSAATEDLTIDLEAGEIVSCDETDSLQHIESVRAGSGNDRIIASEDRNEFWGGDGDDLFVFVSSRAAGNGKHGRDRILDFEVGDRIDIDKLVDEFDRGDDRSRDLRFTLLTGEDTTFTRPGELRLSRYQEFEDGASILILDGNLDRDAEAEFQIEIAGDTDATHRFLTSAFGRAAADQF